MVVGGDGGLDVVMAGRVTALGDPAGGDLLGGLVGVWTWWMLEPAKRAVRAAEPTNGAPAVDEYVIVSGRLTTAPVERAR